jgi:hypothetical protein
MSNNKAKANDFLSDLGIDDELMEEIKSANTPQAKPDEQWIVYFKGEEPDTAWTYHHNPDDGIPYGRLEGYWVDEDKENKVARHYVAHTSNNLKVMDYDTFMDRIVPNKNCTKIYDSEADFLLELI